jgi:hypothetical protein
MTVAELIERLKEMPEYYDVEIYVDPKSKGHDILDIIEVRYARIDSISNDNRSIIWICGD